jgi:hypothetical protein
MALPDIIRSAVKTANSVTQSLQALVTYERSLGDNGYGAINYAPPIEMKALVDWKQRMVRTAAGQLTVTRATVTFLDVNTLLQVTEYKGLNDEDKITLPDGTTGPILDMGGFVDPGTGIPYATEAMIG